jgi:hypothetical protein
MLWGITGARTVLLGSLIIITLVAMAIIHAVNPVTSVAIVFLAGTLPVRVIDLIVKYLLLFVRFGRVSRLSEPRNWDLAWQFGIAVIFAILARVGDQ